MTDRNGCHPGSADKTVRHIQWVARQKYSAEEKIRIVLLGLRGEVLNAEWFTSIHLARVVINQWLRQYNHT
jgi:transposase-like protein